MTCAEANQIEQVEYLYSLGIQPQKIRKNCYRYWAPLRDEKTASFKVNRTLNAWYDFRLGQGGNIIDFGVLYYHGNVSEVLKRLSGIFSFQPPQIPTVQQPLPITQKLNEALEPTIKVIAAKPLTNPSLCRYLNDRKISFKIVKTYCKEVDFELNGKQYFSFKLANISGGFGLRNQHFKGSTPPKNITQIYFFKAKEIAVFEGQFSFLSYSILQNNFHNLTNFLILDSLGFFPKSCSLREERRKINLYLDRDEAGLKHTQNALKWDIKYVDRSHLHKKHKDLNGYLVHKSQQQKHSQKLGRHFNF